MNTKTQTKPKGSGAPEAPRWHDPENNNHSPLPWTFSAIGGDNLIMSKGVPVAEVLYDEAQERIGIEEMDANKTFIVRACNNAERLAEELRQVLKHGSAGNENLIRKALAQWEAGQ
jgi:hypothetical protein